MAVDATQAVTLVAAVLAALAALFVAFTNVRGARETARRNWAREIRVPIYVQFATAAAATVRAVGSASQDVPIETSDQSFPSDFVNESMRNFLREHALQALPELLITLDGATAGLELLGSEDVRKTSAQFMTSSINFATLADVTANAALDESDLLAASDAVKRSYQAAITAIRRDLGTERPSRFVA